MKNRDGKKDKRVERQTEIAGKLPYHRVNKLQKARRHDVDEKFLKDNLGLR